MYPKHAPYSYCNNSPLMWRDPSGMGIWDIQLTLSYCVLLIKKRNNIMDEIIFLIEEDPEDGYNARAIGHSIFTEGDSENELRDNIKDAVACHFDESEKPRIIRLHFVRQEILSNV